MPLNVQHHFSVLWKTEAVSLLKAADEAEKKFELQEACFNYDNVKAYEKC